MQNAAREDKLPNLETLAICQLDRRVTTDKRQNCQNYVRGGQTWVTEWGA